MVEESELEVARLGEEIEAISPNKKEKEYELDITREEIHSRTKPIKGNINYR